MTPEELIKHNPNLIHVVKFMQAHPDHPVRFWADCTVDITLPEKQKLGTFVSTFKCPSCETITQGPPITTDDGDIKGTFRTCDGCNIRYFIHNKVKFGGTPA